MPYQHRYRFNLHTLESTPCDVLIILREISTNFLDLSLLIGIIS